MWSAGTERLGVRAVLRLRAAVSRALLEDAAETDDQCGAVERTPGGCPRLDPSVKPGKNSSMWNVRAPETFGAAAQCDCLAALITERTTPAS